MRKIKLFTGDNVDKVLFNALNKIGSIPGKSFDSYEECLAYVKIEKLTKYCAVDMMTGD